MAIDRHRLTNLPLARKLAATFALLLGLALFVATWLLEIEVTDWSVSTAGIFTWGERLILLRTGQPQLFWGFFAAHALSLLLIAGVATGLLRQVAIARGARTAVVGGIFVLTAIDLAAWVLIDVWAVAPALLGVSLCVLALLLLFAVGRPLLSMWVFRRWRGTGGAPIRVVIVGGGFAGLYTALQLDRRLGYHRDLKITVIDRRNYFLFPPLLPSVAAGSIETRQVTYPFRRLFDASNVVFKKEMVERIDLEAREIHARVDVDDDPETGQPKVIRCATPYDILVLAPGSETNTFGTPGVREHAFFMRELGDAIGVRNQIIESFERAARETDLPRRKELLTFVVCGAGPTGVELAAEVRDLVVHTLLSRYPELDPKEVAVVVVQSGEAILPGWHASIVASAGARLRELAVDLRLGRRVVKVSPFCVDLDDGTKIPSRTCVWCAGVKPSPLLAACGLALHRSGRVEIDPDLRAKGHSDVYVLGDASLCLHQDKPLPPLGQVAFQQGQQAGDNIVRTITGGATKPFRYFNYGSLVSVGEHFAAVDLMGVRLSGFFAWWIWRTLYLTKLVGFGNKVRVVLDWSLDLLIERSFSQISADRERLAAEEPPAPPKG